MRADLSTGDLARATGHTVRAIRFYEEEGLLRPAVVSEGGHRRYTEDDLERLRLICDLRELGLSICEIRSVLDIRTGCHTASEFALRFQQVLAGHLEQAQRRLERLRRVKKELLDALDDPGRRALGRRRRAVPVRRRRRGPCAADRPGARPSGRVLRPRRAPPRGGRPGRGRGAWRRRRGCRSGSGRARRSVAAPPRGSSRAAGLRELSLIDGARSSAARGCACASSAGRDPAARGERPDGPRAGRWRIQRRHRPVARLGRPGADHG